MSCIYGITLHYTLEEGKRTLKRGNMDRLLLVIFKKQFFNLLRWGEGNHVGIQTASMKLFYS